MAQTRPLPDKGGVPFAEYSVYWKVTEKPSSESACREVCFFYNTTPPISTTSDPTSSSSTSTHWYSTFLQKRQDWPLNSARGPSNANQVLPLTTNSKDAYKFSIGSTVEYLFYSSAGFAIFLDDLHPWTINVTETAFCVSTPQMATPEDHPLEYYSLKWRILVAADLVQLWEASIGTVQYISRPMTPPNSALLQRLIWPISLIPKDIDSTTDWEKDIKSFTGHSNYTNALLYIDEVYKEAAPFQLPNESGNSTILVEKFLKKGHQIAFHLSARYPRKETPDKVHCVLNSPQKDVCTFDFTHEPTAFWFIESLTEFRQKTAINTFFLQEATVEDFLPGGKLPFQKPYTVQNSLLLKYPNFLTTLYSSMALPFGRGSSFAIDGAFKSQRLSSFLTFKLESGTTTFTLTTSLAELIPKLLTLSLAGYQFVFPQVVFHFEHDQEAYRRWLSACLFLPALQLPASPWNLNNVGQNFEHQMVKLLELREAVHEQVQMETLIGEWIHRGVAIIRPMWAADVKDERLFTLKDQYMLGPRLVVAPYMEASKNDIYERTVYLPRGNWTDPNGKSLKGGGDIKVNSKLIDVPYFTRQESAI